MNGERVSRGSARSWVTPLQVTFPWAGAFPVRDDQGAVVVRGVENMYSGPDAGRDVVSQALLGQRVSVLESRAGFLRIHTPDGYTGWISGNAVALSDDGGPHGYATRGRVADVVSLMANVYSEPTVTRSRPLMQAPLGTRLELLNDAAAPGWLVVMLPHGAAAFVQAGDAIVRDARAPRPRGSGEAIVATARRFLGVPYLWGGLSPWGVDCSGLVSRVYEVHGVTLLRDAYLQFDDPRGVRVEPDDLRPGDLVFFGLERIAHVGLCAGRGRFVHATTEQRPLVQESALREPHWTALYRGARRMP
jgi:cell wall-associated NlpC family hydrolase